MKVRPVFRRLALAGPIGAIWHGCGDGAPSPPPPTAASTAAVAPAPSTAPPPPAPPAPYCPEHACEPGVMTVSDEGWVNAWTAHVGVQKKAADKLWEGGHVDAVGGERSAKAICAADGYVQPRRAADARDPVFAVLRGALLSRERRELELRVSVAGKLRLRLGEASYEIEELPGREGRPLPDERFFTVTVDAGRTPVVAVLEPETGGFSMRLREKDGTPARGLAFAGGDCAPEALLDARVDLALGPWGLRVGTAPRTRGLVPRLEPTERLRVVVSSKGDREMGDVALARQEIASGVTEPRSFVVTPPPMGAFTVQVRLGDRVLWSQEIDAGPELLERARRAVALAARAARQVRLPEGSRASLAHHARVVAESIVSGERDKDWVRAHIGRLESLLAIAQEGGDPYERARGVVFRAYRSPLDGRLQPYVTFVPPSYDREEVLPLVLVAHGRDRLPEHALRTLVGEAPDEHMTLSFAAKHLPPIADQRAILAAPWGYGNAGVQGVGEHDVLHVVDELVRAYRVDLRRVSLTGYSLGGTISFVVPLHHPGRFAAAAPLCGYPNLLGYRSVAGVPHLDFEEAILAKEYIVRYAENGLHLPLHIVHGGQDVPGRSQVVADRYKALGYRRVFDVPEELDHNVWDYAYENGKMIPWLTAHELPEAPAHVRLTTGKYRYDRAFWIRLVHMLDASGAEPASLDARYDRGAARVTVETRNVAAFAIQPQRLGADRPDQLTFVVDGSETQVAGAGEVVLVRDASGAFAPGAPTPGAKTHGSSGPLDDVQHGPLTIVYGAADPTMTEANRMVAEHLATLGATAEVRYPVLSDVEATDEALADRNVVLVGAPSQNAITAAIEASLPVRFEHGAIVFRGRRHEGSHLAVTFIQPRPTGFFGEGTRTRSSARYVVVHAGTSPRAILAARMLPRYLPDFVVYDDAMGSQRGGLLMDRRPVRDAGFFTEDWR